jgi:hypothetical protein
MSEQFDLIEFPDRHSRAADRPFSLPGRSNKTDREQEEPHREEYSATRLHGQVGKGWGGGGLKVSVGSKAKKKRERERERKSLDCCIALQLLLQH